MKRISILTIMLFCSIISYAQPYTINYQGIARNEKGLPYANTLISIRINLRESSVNGPIVFSETRQVTTNAQGLFSLAINGIGAITQTGDLESVNWSQFKYLETEIDPTGGSSFKKIGTTLLSSVPSALMAYKVATPLEVEKNETMPLISIKNTGSGTGLLVEAGSNNGIFANSSTTAAGIRAHGAKTGATGLSATAVAGAYALKVNGDINITSTANPHGDGKVLTSDASGNATWQTPASSTSVFRASGLKGNVFQKFTPSSGFKKVMFYEVDRIDLADEYDAPNSIFFPKNSGVYHLNVQVQWNEAVHFSRIRVMLLRNGVVSEIASDYTGTTGNDAVLESRTNRAVMDISLYKNDAIWVEAYYSGSYEGYANISSNGMDTWFSGHLIHKY